MKFNKGDKVKVNISFWNKIGGSIYYYLNTGIRSWPPETAYIIEYREEVAAWEVYAGTGVLRVWYVDESKLERCQ